MSRFVSGLHKSVLSCCIDALLPSKASSHLLGFHNMPLVVMRIVSADPQAKPLCWNAVSHSHIYKKCCEPYGFE